MTIKQTDLEYWRERAIDLDSEAIHLRAEVERLKRLYDDVYAENERLQAALDQVRAVVRTGIPVDKPDAVAAWRLLNMALDSAKK